MILVIIKTGKRVVAMVGIVALRGSWSGGRRGKVPPKSDWSAVVYQQLAVCLARPVIKYCWSSSVKKYYLQIIPFEILNSFAWFTVQNVYVKFSPNVFIILLHSYIQIINTYKNILKKMFDSNNFEVKMY
jgi:hypothetical protein